MKIKKSLVAILTLIMLTCSMMTTTAFAQSSLDSYSDSTDGVMINGTVIPRDSLDEINEGILEILPSPERIDGSGRFTFDVHYSVTSTNFKVSQTSIKIKISAIVEDSDGKDVSSSYPDHRYRITLYKKSLLGSKIATTTYYADGTNYTWDVVGLNTSDTYYFTIDNVDYLPDGTNVSGSGLITNYVNP